MVQAKVAEPPMSFQMPIVSLPIPDIKNWPSGESAQGPEVITKGGTFAPVVASNCRKGDEHDIFPKRLNQTVDTLDSNSSAFQSSLLVERLQRRIDLSQPAVAKYLPSLEKERDTTRDSCPGHSRSVSPVATSDDRTTLSQLPDQIFFPSGEKHIDTTGEK
jgi:hypothetical protein